jgi:hypothetical protein
MATRGYLTAALRKFRDNQQLPAFAQRSEKMAAISI